MTRAFRLNLTALSLLALVCGAFLIYNTMTFSVVQRRRLIGTLRALGVTRAQIFALVLGEALAVALLGTAAGLGAGVLLGRGLVRLVTQTINDLYFVVSVRELAIPACDAARGRRSSASGPRSWRRWCRRSRPPRRRRGRCSLRSTLEARLRRPLPRATAPGGSACSPPAARCWRSRRNLAVSFAGLFAVILGCALLCPRSPPSCSCGSLRRPLGAALRRARPDGGRRGRRLALAHGGGHRRPGDRGLGDGRHRGDGRQLPADGRPLAGDVAAVGRLRLGAQPGRGVQRARTSIRRWRSGRRRCRASRGAIRSAGSRSPRPSGPVRLVAIGAGDREHRAAPSSSRRGDPPTAWPAFQEGDAVLVSEPFASPHRPGDRLDGAPADRAGGPRLPGDGRLSTTTPRTREWC